MTKSEIRGNRLIRRILRYGAVGASISVVYSLMVVALVDGMGLRNATLASMLAFAIVLPVAYAAHRRITFLDAVRDPLEPVRFALSTTAAFLIATAAMYVATEVLGRTYLLGIAINWLLIPGANFLIYLLWVFRLRDTGALNRYPMGNRPSARRSRHGDDHG